MPREAINWTQGDVKSQFVSGNLAMMVNGPWQIPPMRSDAPNLNWGVALIPRDAKNASVLGGENWAVINNANTAASLEFIKFVSAPDAVKRTADTFGYIAPRKDVATGQFSGDAAMQKFVEQLQYAQPRGPHARWPEISDAISLAFNEVMTQRATPAQAAAKAQATIDGIVK
jgi:multiple sugar transport system substrate-binding protein